MSLTPFWLTKGVFNLLAPSFPVSVKHDSYMPLQKKNDQGMPQGLMGGKPTSQYAAYLVLFAPLRNNVRTHTPYPDTWKP